MFLEELSTEPQDTLLVDAGNVLFSVKKSGRLLQQDIIGAKGIYDIYASLGYQAIGVGPYDLSAGIDFLTELSGAVPLISSNLVTRGENYIFQPWTLMKHQEGTIGIITLTGQPHEEPQGYTFLDWQTAIERVLEKISIDCEAIILLTSLDTATIKQIADKFPGLHLILTADKRRGNQAPQKLANSLTSQVQSRGRYLGILTFPLGITSIGKVSNTTQHHFQHRLIAIDQSLKKSEHAEKMVANVQKEIALIGNRQQFKKGKSFAHQAPVDGHRLLGHQSCVTCHSEIVSKWLKSAHSSSYHILVDKNQQYNLRCLICHVTSPDKTNLSMKDHPLKPENASFTLLQLPDELRSVSCLACHAGAGIHADTSGSNANLQKITEKQCTSCHTKERDPEFNFSVKKKFIH